MTNVLRARARTALWCAAAVAATLLLASSAVALPTAPTSLASDPASPTAASAVTITWQASTPDLGSIIGYEGGLVANPSAEPAAAPVTSGEVVSTPDVGQLYFRVRARQDDGVGGITVSPYSGALPILIDRAAPSISVAFSTAPNAAGWFRAPLALQRSCSDDNTLPAGACADIVWTTDGANISGQTVSVTDVAGKTTTIAVPTFSYDKTAPNARPDATAPGALIAAQPTFSWFPAKDATSGVNHYVVQYQLDDNFPGPWIPIATVPDDHRLGEYTASPDALSPLPENTLLDWQIVAFDAAGNTRASQLRQTTIDPTVPPAPTITGGPSAPTQNTSPTFTWEGTGQSFRWDVVPAGTQNPVRSGSGPNTETTIQSLGDGAYTFRLTQVTLAGRESAEAVRSFVVDTTPPEAPAILTRPTFPSLVTPVFTWGTEPGAYSRWSVLGGGGAIIAGPVDTPVTSAEIPALADGAYSFQVQQIDAAGNVSAATVEPFTVIAPLVPDPATGPGGTITLLPRQFARRLQPKAGKIVMSRQPLLRWTRGPRGTKLFNLQIFRVTLVRGRSTPRVVKVLSVFPKGRAYRVPRTKTLPKTCYVWRVWPYTGREFTPKPLGVSNYCIASARVLKKTARVIAAHKAARARSTRR